MPLPGKVGTITSVVLEKSRVQPKPMYEGVFWFFKKRYEFVIYWSFSEFGRLTYGIAVQSFGRGVTAFILWPLELKHSNFI